MSVDELVGASRQLDVSSLYDEDAEQQQQQQSATTSSKRFAEPLSAENLHIVQHNGFPKNAVSGATWAVSIFGDLRTHRNRRCVKEQHLDLIY